VRPVPGVPLIATVPAVTRGASARIVDAWRPWSGTWKHAIGWALVTASVGILVWVGVVAVTGSQSLYLAVVLGAAVGFAVHAGSRRDRWKPAALAAAIAAVAAVVGLYYVNRFTFVQNELDAGRDLAIPILPDWAWFTFVLEQGVRAEQYQLLYVALAPLLAVFVAYRGTDALADP
jgi:hypothetical protein